MRDESPILPCCLAIHLRLTELMGTDLLSLPDATEEHVASFRSSEVSYHSPYCLGSGFWRIFPFFRFSLVSTLLGALFAADLLSLGAGNETLRAPPILATRQVAVAMQGSRLKRSAPLGPTGLPMHAVTSDEQSSSQSDSSSSSADAVVPASASGEELIPSLVPMTSSDEGSVEPVSSEDTPEKAASVPPVRSDNKIGVYLTAQSVSRQEFFSGTIDSLVAASGSAVVFDVKGGVVMFHAAAPLANELDLVRPFYDLPAIIAALHERGVYVIGRFVAIKDAGFTEKKPETRIRHPKTGKVLSQTWIDPADDTAIQYNMEVICDLAGAGIDEVNLDYIRFSTAEVGALSVYSGAEKADRVEKFLRAARDTIDRCGSGTKLGISTYAILGWRYDINMETLGQDVVRFAPLVDVISPMAYPATFAAGHYYRPGKDPGSRMYYLVYRTLTGYGELLGPEQSAKIRPWIQGYGVQEQDVADEIKAVYDAGYCGFTVWNANNAYATSFKAIRRDSRPDHCKT